MINKKELEQIRKNIESARLRANRSNTPPVEIVAITKTFPPEDIVSVAEAGLNHMGENRTQEAEAKFANLPPLKITKRLVGHLQSNKAKKAVQIFDAIDSIDSVKIGKRVSRIAIETGKPIPALLQVNTARDPKKYGFKIEEIEEMLSLIEEGGLQVEGLMTIGRLSVGCEETREAFKKLRELKDNLNTQLSPEKELFELSMGMTSDYEIAVEEGATMVRIGTALFGERK